jgi:hypothetical protein
VKRLDTPRNGQRIGTCRSRSSFKLVESRPRSGQIPDEISRSAATFPSLQVVHKSPTIFQSAAFAGLAVAASALQALLHQLPAHAPNGTPERLERGGPLVASCWFFSFSVAPPREM